MVRVRFVVCALLIGLLPACGDKKSSDGDKKAEPAPPPGPAAIDDLATAIKKLPPIDMRRLPMRATPAASKDPRAVTFYDKARDQAAKALGDTKPKDLLGYADRWASAPADVRELGASKYARDTANTIAVGAGTPVGGLPLKAGTNSDAHIAAGAVAIAAALENAAQNKPERAAWQLLAVVRMGQDLARGTKAEQVDPAAKLIRSALAGLRQVITTADRKKLSSEALGSFLTGCQIVAASHINYREVLNSDLRLTADALIAEKSTDKALIDKLILDVGLVEQLGDAKLTRGSQKQEALAAHQAKVWPQDAPTVINLDRYGRWLMAGGDAKGTCLVVALELDRRTRKKGALVSKLEQLTPKPLTQPILDPLGSRPWEYVDDGFGGRVLRSAPVLLGKATANVEMRIPKRKR